MNKEKKVYFLLIISFILFVCVFISTFIIKNINIKGKTNIIKKYSEVKYESNNDELFIHDDIVSVRLNELKDELSFNIYNIGNNDIKVSYLDIGIINTNLNRDKLNIKLDLNKNDVIKGGQVKRVVVYIDYDKNEIKENSYLNFDLKYSFSE